MEPGELGSNPSTFQNQLGTLSEIWFNLLKPSFYHFRDEGCCECGMRSHIRLAHKYLLSTCCVSAAVLGAEFGVVMPQTPALPSRRVTFGGGGETMTECAQHMTAITIIITVYSFLQASSSLCTSVSSLITCGAELK